MKELYTNDPQDCNDLSPDERAEMEAAFNAMTTSDDRRPNPFSGEKAA